MLHELLLGHLQSPRSFIKIIASKAVSLAASIETSTRRLARIFLVSRLLSKAPPATSRVDHDVVAVSVQERIAVTRDPPIASQPSPTRLVSVSAWSSIVLTGVEGGPVALEERISSRPRSHAAQTWALRPGPGFRQDCVNRRRASCYGDQFSLFQRKTVPVPHSGIVAPALPGTHAGSAWFPDFAAIAGLAPSASGSGPTRK